MRCTCLLAVLLLTGCDRDTLTADTSPEPSATEAKPPELPSYDSRPDCENAGGKWKAWCTPNKASCVMPWPDGGNQCTDSSECESRMCMVDLTITCNDNKECQEPVIPKPGESALGICKREDVSCGSYFEIRGGLAQEPYHVD